MEKKNKKALDPISQAFGLEPMDGKLKPSGKILVPDPTDDYQYSRQVIIDMIEKGMAHYAEFGTSAQAAGEPRHYEVLNNMGTSIIMAAEKLMILQKLDMDMKAQAAKNETAAGNQTINNNLVVGSADDMLTMLEKIDERRRIKSDEGGEDE